MAKLGHSATGDQVDDRQKAPRDANSPDRVEPDAGLASTSLEALVASSPGRRRIFTPARVLVLQRLNGNQTVTAMLQRLLDESVDRKQLIAELQAGVPDAPETIINHALDVQNALPNKVNYQEAIRYAAQWVPRFLCAQRVDEVLTGANVNYVIGGSFSSFINGSSRMADDLDVHVGQKQVLVAVEALEKAGFERDTKQSSRLVNELLPKDEKYHVPDLKGRIGTSKPFHVQVADAEDLGDFEKELKEGQKRAKEDKRALGLSVVGGVSAVAERLMTLRQSGRNHEEKQDLRVLADLIRYNRLTRESGADVQAAIRNAPGLKEQYDATFAELVKQRLLTESAKTK
jgi:hypothetical protein